MSERCSNCGAELYAGQQFCRRCGEAVRGAAGDSTDAPTRLLPHETHTAPAPAGTSPFGADTNAVGRSQPTAYQPPFSSFGHTSALDASHAQGRRRGGWLTVMLVVFLLGVGVAGGAGYMWWRSHQRMIVVRKTGVGDAGMPDVPLPPELPEHVRAKVKEAVGKAGIPLPLDESGATVSGAETILTKTYEIDEDATFSIRGVNGNVAVTGVEGDRAEVKIIKHGGSPQEREGVRVLVSQTDEGLSFISAAAGGEVGVSYEIKLPRNLHQLEISSETSEVKISDFGGTVVADVRQGALEFRDVTGTVKSKLIKGSTKVFYRKPEREGAQEFSVVRGQIEATFADGVNADLKAETIDGDISVADQFGFNVEKRPAGRYAVGRIGDGGSESLLFKVTNGDIKLKK